jgi:hypothetical protein
MDGAKAVGCLEHVHQVERRAPGRKGAPKGRIRRRLRGTRRRIHARRARQEANEETRRAGAGEGESRRVRAVAMSIKSALLMPRHHTHFHAACASVRFAVSLTVGSAKGLAVDYANGVAVDGAVVLDFSCA